MANIVDELVVKLGLDNKEFKKGAKDAEGQLNKVKDTATTASKNLQQQGKKGAVFFTELQKSALKFFSVMAVGAAGFRAFSNLISSGAHLSRLATNLGTSANSLHKWGQAVKQSGGTAAGLESTMRGLSAAMTEQQTTGTSSIAGWLSVLGVSLVDAEGKAKKVEDLMLDIGEGVKNKTGNRADQFNILQSMGIDEGTSNLLLKTRKEAEALIASQPGMSDAAAKKAQDINEQWEALVERVRGKVRELAIQHFPAIERAVIAISNAFERMSPFITTMTEGFSELNKITDGWLTNILLALGALKLVKGFIPGVGAAAAGGIGAGGAIAAGAAGYAGYQAGSLLYDKAIAGTSAGDVIGKGVAKVLSFFGNKDAKEAIESNERYKRVQGGQEVSGKVTPFGGAVSNQAAASSTRQTRAERNNNPGNLNFARQTGAVLESGTGARFAKFNTVEEGIAALVKQLQRYQARGTDTISKIMEIYAPRSENNTDAYISSMEKWTGLGSNQALDFNDPETLKKMIYGISRKEGRYTPLSEGQIMSGIRTAGVNGGSSSPSITIGKIDIQTAATDARGIAKDIRQELIAQANTGMR